MEAGKITTNAAYNQMKKRQKKAELQQKAAEASHLAEQPEWTLINQDVLDGLQSVIDNHSRARLIVTDPPYNIGIDYGDGKAADALSDDDYLDWVTRWLRLCMDALTDDGSLWVIINDEYAAEYVVALKSLGFHEDRS